VLSIHRHHGAQASTAMDLSVTFYCAFAQPESEYLSDASLISHLRRGRHLAVSRKTPLQLP
jgi:hypothetical protein